jgi:hypothetical protein
VLAELIENGLADRQGGFEIGSHAGGEIPYPVRISLIPRSGQEHGCPWNQNRDIAWLQRDRPIHVGHRGISQNSGVGRVASAERLPRLPVAGSPPPHQSFRVIGICPQLRIDDRHRILERRFVAAESPEHVVADLIVETLLGKTRGGDADCDHGCEADGSAPCHRRTP